MRAPIAPMRNPSHLLFTRVRLGRYSSDTLHLSPQLSTLAVTLHCTSQRNVHDVSMCAYCLRAKMRLSGPVLPASLPSTLETAFVPPLCPRVQNAFLANCSSVDESQEGFDFRIRIVIGRAGRAMRLPLHSDDNMPTYITVRAPINLIVFVYHPTSYPNNIYVDRWYNLNGC